MEQADKFSYATTSGICTIFASCVGGHMYHDSHKSGIYSEDKYIYVDMIQIHSLCFLLL